MKKSLLLLFLVLITSGCTPSNMKNEDTPKNSIPEKKVEEKDTSTQDEKSPWRSYGNQEFELSFRYNIDDFETPQYLENPEQIYLKSKDFIEGTANSQVSFTKVSNVSGNYIESETARIKAVANGLSTGGCEIRKTDQVGEQKAFWYQCAGMGDTETVLIEYPSREFVLQISSDFSKPSFEEMVMSLSFRK
jgi:hypothetical protein